jgi:chromosome transmission fidelity protein 1
MEPESFGFPFEPYTIQKDFMKELYSALSNGKIGIFESPTGTVGSVASFFCVNPSNMNNRANRLV